MQAISTTLPLNCVGEICRGCPVAGSGPDRWIAISGEGRGSGAGVATGAIKPKLTSKAGMERIKMESPRNYSLSHGARFGLIGRSQPLDTCNQSPVSPHHKGAVVAGSR